MSFLSMLYSLLIGPLQLLFEVIFSFANKITGHPGITIISLSLSMNFLILPLYMRADALQEEEKNIELKLSKGVAHIKKTFKGDERMMMLQTYYRQNDYKPTYVLRGATSLFLEIPFFIAAYRFLSTLQLLQGVSFGPIADLGKPDGLLVIGGVAINLLPIIMTGVNAISTAIFTKGYPVKTKVQLYGMALFFLVFLYTSPSGLVFYWTLNNVFSLVKTIFYKLKNPKKVLTVMAAIAGLAALIFGFARYMGVSNSKLAFFIIFGLLLEIPLLLRIVGKIRAGKAASEGSKAAAVPSYRLFIITAAFMTILTGVLIPSNVIKTSALEFVNVSAFYNPTWYVVSAFLLAAGTFLVWIHVFYRLSNDKTKVGIEYGLCIFSGIAVTDYMFFGKNLGTLLPNLQYENDMTFAGKEKLLNLLAIAVVAAAVVIVCHFKKKIAADIMLVFMLAIIAMSGRNIYKINKTIAPVKQTAEEGSSKASFTLSKTGKNVIVIMLDRAMGEYVPYIMSEKPELMEKFSGFTYYGNTISYGGHTNFGSPALFGGYEYRPEQINERADEALVDKHNESLKVMPVLFSENGYNVTVCDAPDANYAWTPDMSIYDEYPDIATYITNGSFVDEETDAAQKKVKNRNFFCYAIAKSSPLIIQDKLYEGGNYHNLSDVNLEIQTTNGLEKADGLSEEFEEAYAVLENMDTMTNITDEDCNNFLMMANDTTHENIMLQKPDYVPALHVDNTAYPEENRTASDFFGDASNRILRVTDWDNQLMQYHCQMATFIKLGEWFDFLKENGVYDNTKIILVSDHGYNLLQLEELVTFYDNTAATDLEFYFPLLMVKDYGAEEFTVSEEFMTNADVPTIATNDNIEDPVNPFTGNEINSEPKSEKYQYIINSDEWETTKNNGNQFLPSRWLAVDTDDIWNKNNWVVAGDDATLPTRIE